MIGFYLWSEQHTCAFECVYSGLLKSNTVEALKALERFIRGFSVFLYSLESGLIYCGAGIVDVHPIEETLTSSIINAHTDSVVCLSFFCNFVWYPHSSLKSTWSQIYSINLTAHSDLIGFLRACYSKGTLLYFYFFLKLLVNINSAEINSSTWLHGKIELQCLVINIYNRIVILCVSIKY